MSTLDLSSYMLKIPNDAYIILSKILIGCSLLSVERNARLIGWYSTKIRGPNKKWYMHPNAYAFIKLQRVTEFYQARESLAFLASTTTKLSLEAKAYSQANIKSYNF